MYEIAWLSAQSLSLNVDRPDDHTAKQEVPQRNGVEQNFLVSKTFLVGFGECPASSVVLSLLKLWSKTVELSDQL